MFKKNTDLSSGILQEFVPDLIGHYGLLGNITVIAYDAVQSLMAAGTDKGSVHVFGEGSIQRDLYLKKPQPIIFLRFVKSIYLIAVDDSNLITVWDIDTGAEWATYQSAATVSAIHADPAMDWLFLGHHSGTTTCFDIDRGHITPLKIDNLERIVDNKNRMGYVQNLILHPRDPSLILICYRQVAVVWSLTSNEIVYDMVHEFPLHQAHWHPSGSHVVTSHVNGELVFWDGQKGVKLGSRLAFGLNGYMGPCDVAWCCRDDPTNTFLMISSGVAVRVVDFGATPVVSVTSYEAMGKFFEGGTASPDVRLPGNVKNTPVIVSENNKPHHTGTHNPTAVILQLDNPAYEYVVVALPTPFIVQLNSLCLPPGLSWRSSLRTFATLQTVPRTQWLGMMAVAPRHALNGGRAAPQKIRRQPLSSAVVVGSQDGTVKIFDGTNADSRDYRVLSTTIRVIDPKEVPVCASLSGFAGELAVASHTGSVYLMTFKKNTSAKSGIGLSKLTIKDPADGQIIPIDHEAPLELREGFIPMFKLHGTSRVSALCNSHVGFVAVGYEFAPNGDGAIRVVDRRGPAVILDEPIKGAPTFIDFGIMVLGQEQYSSIVLSVGTNRGEVIVYKILPRPQGGFFCQRAFSFSAGSGKFPVIHLAHVNLDEGKSATAVPDVMAKLASGFRVQGAIVAVTSKEARMMAITGKSGASKMGSKNFDTPLMAAAYMYIRWGQSSALVTLNVKGKTGVYGLPGLSTLSTFAAPRKVCPTLRGGATEMGDVFFPLDEKLEKCYLMRVWGAGEDLVPDDLFSLRRKVPARPMISTVSWVKGIQYVKPEDLDKHIAGGKRGKSRRGNQILVETAASNTVSDKPNGTESSSGSGWGWGSGFKHSVKKSPRTQKSWGQTLDEYYNAAEEAVNDALDQGVQSMRSTQGDATKSAMSGIIGAKLGF